MLFIIRCLFLSIFFLTGCNEKNIEPSNKQTVRISIGAEPQSLDPRKVRDSISTALMHMFFEGLTRFGKGGELEMALAESVEISEDGLEYRFRLRKSLWSNGDPVTAFDFAESWKTILDPRFPTDIASQLYDIKNARKAKLGEIALEQVGITTPDAGTLVVELETSVPYFLQLLSMPSFFPVHQKTAARDPQWALRVDAYVCNGPFVLKDWKHSDQITVVKNPTYWQAKDVALHSIELCIMDSSTEIQMFEEGKLDWAGSPLSILPVDTIRTLKGKNILRSSPFSATYFFRVNTARQISDKKNPLSSPSFRKALAFAIDRKAITDHILQGGHKPAKGLVPPEMGLSELGYFQDDHPERAGALLTDALLELDLTLSALEPIQLSYKNDERNASIAQAVQKQWEQVLGIKVALEAVEPKIFFQRVSQKEYQLAAGSWTADFDDPINFLEVFKYKETSANNTHWENSKYVDLLTQSGICRDARERRGLLRDAEQILMDEMPIIPIFHYILNFMQSADLQEVALSPLGQIDFRWAHVEKR
ncbi:MAG: peptide ABC transporter substrate-binding protein [Chlamydiales bacterium]